MGGNEAFDPNLDMRHIIDLVRYPLEQPDAPACLDVVDRGRTRLAEDGSATLPGFLLPEGIAALQREVSALRPLAFESIKTENPYTAPVTPDLPARHPYRIKSPTHRFGVAYLRAVS